MDITCFKSFRLSVCFVNESFLPVCLSVSVACRCRCLSACLSVYVFLCLLSSVRLFRPFAFLFLRLSILRPNICLSGRLVCLYDVCMFVYVYLAVCLLVCLSMSVYLSICPSCIVLLPAPGESSLATLLRVTSVIRTRFFLRGQRKNLWMLSVCYRSKRLQTYLRVKTIIH